MTTEVPLTKGYIALIDDEDAPSILKYHWQVLARKLKRGIHLAARRAIWDRQEKRQVFVYMHRVILDCPATHQIDHKNRNGLDNRRTNLRIATVSENLANRHYGPNKHGFRGVSGGPGRFYGSISCNRKPIHTEPYQTAEEAARARDALAVLHFGEFAYLNFPVSGAATSDSALLMSLPSLTPAPVENSR